MAAREIENDVARLKPEQLPHELGLAIVRLVALPRLVEVEVVVVEDLFAFHAAIFGDKTWPG